MLPAQIALRRGLLSASRISTRLVSAQMAEHRPACLLPSVAARSQSSVADLKAQYKKATELTMEKGELYQQTEMEHLLKRLGLLLTIDIMGNATSFIIFEHLTLMQQGMIVGGDLAVNALLAVWIVKSYRNLKKM